MEALDNIKGLEIYTPKGIFVGVVDEMIMNITEMKAEALFVKDANPVLVDKNVSISIPMRWIQCIGDVIILNRFPSEVVTPDSV